MLLYDDVVIRNGGLTQSPAPGRGYEAKYCLHQQAKGVSWRSDFLLELLEFWKAIGSHIFQLFFVFRIFGPAEPDPLVGLAIGLQGDEGWHVPCNHSLGWRYSLRSLRYLKSVNHEGPPPASSLAFFGVKRSQETGTHVTMTWWPRKLRLRQTYASFAVPEAQCRFGQVRPDQVATRPGSQKRPVMSWTSNWVWKIEVWLKMITPSKNGWFETTNWQFFWVLTLHSPFFDS